MTVSIMIVTFNRLELTKRTFESLFNCTDYPYRLIIADNGSTDGTQDYLNSLKAPEICKSIDLIFNKENKGIGIGRNQTLKKSNEYNDEWLSTIDNDILFVDGWLSECVDIMSAVPKLSIGMNLENVKYPEAIINNKTFQIKKEGNLGTACMVFPRHLHKTIGFFNQSYEFYAHEDADFGFRARLVGYKLGYLTRSGIHIGEGENDKGEYREFKNKHHAQNLKMFYDNCAAYYHGKKSYYIPCRI